MSTDFLEFYYSELFRNLEDISNELPKDSHDKDIRALINTSIRELGTSRGTK
jgi:hypothetical protein